MLIARRGSHRHAVVGVKHFLQIGSLSTDLAEGACLPHAAEYREFKVKSREQKHVGHSDFGLYKDVEQI